MIAPSLAHTKVESRHFLQVSPPAARSPPPMTGLPLHRGHSNMAHAAPRANHPGHPTPPSVVGSKLVQRPPPWSRSPTAPSRAGPEGTHGNAAPDLDLRSGLPWCRGVQQAPGQAGQHRAHQAAPRSRYQLNSAEQLALMMRYLGTTAVPEPNSKPHGCSSTYRYEGGQTAPDHSHNCSSGSHRGHEPEHQLQVRDIAMTPPVHASVAPHCEPHPRTCRHSAQQPPKPSRKLQR